MGRYPLPPGMGKTAKLMISLTPAEKELIVQAAFAAGLSVSAYLVGAALGDRLGGLIIGEGFTSSEEARSKRLPNPAKQDT